MTEPPSARPILAAAKGGGYIAGGTFFAFAARFGIAFILARSLGAQDYGLYVLAVSAASLFGGVSMLGLDDAMVRYVAIQEGRRDDAGLWGTLQIGFGLSILFGVVVGAALFVLTRPIAVGLFHEPELTPLLHLLAVVVPFLTLSNLLLGVARGFGRMDYASFAEKVIQSIVRLVLVALLAFVGRLNLYLAAAIFGVSDVASSVTLIFLLNRLFPFRRPLREKVRRDVRPVMGFAIPLWLSGLLRQFRRNIQNVLLGAIGTVTDVGVFSIVARVTLVGSVCSSAIYVAVKPILAQLHDRRDVRALAALYSTATRWTLSLNMPFFLVMVLYPKPILAVFGRSFATGASALVLLAFSQLADAATGICQPMIDMTGHTRIKLANTVLWTVLLIGGGALLIPRMGVAGAATASLVAVATVNVAAVVEVWVIEGLQPFDRTFLKPAGAAVAAFLVGLALKSLFPVGSAFVSAAVQGTLVSFLYLGLLLLLGLEPDDRLVAHRVIKKIASLAGRRAAPPHSAGERAA